MLGRRLKKNQSMKILAKLCPNNKLQIKRYRLADGYLRAKRSDDSSEARQSEYEAVKLAEAERISRTIQSVTETHTNTLVEPELTQLGLFGVTSNQAIGRHETHAQYCTLPQTIELANINPSNQEVYIEKTSYYEEAVRRQVALDLLKKSQQTVKKPRPWGKKQSEKIFRYQAGEKIKEGGAIIDRFCGASNATMVTLTLPGSTYRAMDALARWSGWIVNRLTQIFRRVDSSAPPVHWFFVWEHQKRGALHMHWCLGWKVSQGFREELCERVAAKWWQCLKEIGTKEGIDLFERRGFQGTWRNRPEKWQYDIQQIEKSVAAYFAKYCQKNRSYNGESKLQASEQSVEFRQRANQNNPRSFTTYPSRYWGSSRTVKDWCSYLGKSRVFDDSGDESVKRMLEAVKSLLLRVGTLRYVNHSEFQCIDEKSGVCYASGDVWTFGILPEDYPEFWLYCMDAIIERDVCMDAKLREFLLSG